LLLPCHIPLIGVALVAFLVPPLFYFIILNIVNSSNDKYNIFKLNTTLLYANSNIPCDFIVNKMKPTFRNIIIKSGAQGRPVIIIAKTAVFKDEICTLSNGSLISVDNEKRYIASFEKTDITLATLWSTQEKGPVFNIKDPKYMHWSEVLENRSRGHKGARTEFHIRLARALWQFSFPFIAVLITLSLCGVGGNSLFLSFTSSLLLMFFSYISIGTAQAFRDAIVTFLIILYGSIALLFSFSLLMYRRYKV